MDICELHNNPNWRERRHPWERARVRVFADMLKDYFGQESNSLNVLDIGAGDAYLAYNLSRIFPDLKVKCIDTGYTPEIKAELAKQINDANISFYDSLEEYKYDNPSFTADIILLLDVLEHIEDDRKFLKTLLSEEVIHLDTKVLIAVPTYQSLFGAHDIFLNHYRRYTLHSLMETLSACSLQSVKKGYLFFSLVTVRYIQRRFNISNKVNKQKGISRYKPVFLADQLMYNMLLLDYYLFKGLGRLGIRASGLSCYTICQKK